MRTKVVFPDEITEQKIVSYTLGDKDFVLVLSNQKGRTKTLTIKDDQQDCCEVRYITCDDDLSSFIGEGIKSIESETCEDRGCGYNDVHDICFVKVETTGGTITLCTHNEHNGYYGGFDVQVTWA